MPGRHHAMLNTSWMLARDSFGRERSRRQKFGSGEQARSRHSARTKRTWAPVCGRGDEISWSQPGMCKSRGLGLTRFDGSRDGPKSWRMGFEVPLLLSCCSHSPALSPPLRVPPTVSLAEEAGRSLVCVRLKVYHRPPSSVTRHTPAHFAASQRCSSSVVNPPATSAQNHTLRSLFLIPFPAVRQFLPDCPG